MVIKDTTLSQREYGPRFKDRVECGARKLLALDSTAFWNWLSRNLVLTKFLLSLLSLTSGSSAPLIDSSPESSLLRVVTLQTSLRWGVVGGGGGRSRVRHEEPGSPASWILPLRPHC